MGLYDHRDPNGEKIEEGIEGGEDVGSYKLSLSQYTCIG
jgi:hypothetical protein